MSATKNVAEKKMIKSSVIVEGMSFSSVFGMVIEMIYEPCVIHK